MQVFEAKNDSAPEYHRAAVKALEHITDRGEAWNLALVQTEEAMEALVGEGNPYLTTKAFFFIKGRRGSTCAYRDDEPATKATGLLAEQCRGSHAMRNWVECRGCYHQIRQLHMSWLSVSAANASTGLALKLVIGTSALRPFLRVMGAICLRAALRLYPFPNTAMPC